MTGKERKERQKEFDSIPEVDLKYVDFGARIRQLRLEMGMSQVEFAEKLGLSKQILSLYEAGKRSPKIAQVKKFAEILKVSVDYLLGDSLEEAAFYSICATQDKPFYKIFIEVTADQMGLDIPGIVRMTGLTDRQVRTIITRRMKEAPLPIALQLSDTLDVPLEVWAGTVPYHPHPLPAEAVEVAKAYERADMKDKNTARLALGLELIKEVAKP